MYIYVYIYDISSLRVNTSAHCSGLKQVNVGLLVYSRLMAYSGFLCAGYRNFSLFACIRRYLVFLAARKLTSFTEISLYVNLFFFITLARFISHNHPDVSFQDSF